MSSAEPVIFKIETFQTNGILVHFDTEPNRQYILQYFNGVPGTNRLGFKQEWSNLYTGFAFPFPNHYIVPDTRTTPQRIYRLAVTP